MQNNIKKLHRRAGTIPEVISGRFEFGIIEVRQFSKQRKQIRINRNVYKKNNKIFRMKGWCDRINT